MLKKAFSTVACMGMDYKTIINACLKYGISGIEIRMDNDGGICGLKEDAELKALARDVKESGLVITDLGSSVCFKEYSLETVEFGKKCVDMAAMAEIKAMRVFLGNFAAQFNPDKQEPDHEGIVKALKELCSYAHEKNVEIWIETHNEYATGKVLKKLLLDVGAENMKIIWDIVHPIEDGETIKETWGYIGNSIAHIHIKDGYNRGDKAWHDYYYTELGHGALPVASVIELLKANNFGGYLSFEWESLWRQELKGFDNSLEYVLNQYNLCFEECEKNMIPAYNDKGWEKFDSEKIGNGFEIAKDGSYVRLYDERPKAPLKKMMYTLAIEDGKMYTISVPYSIKKIKHEIMVYGIVTLYDKEDKWTRRLYFERPCKEKLEKVFKATGEVKLTVELGLKTWGDVLFYRPTLKEGGELKSRKVKLSAVHLKPGNGKISYEDTLKRIGDSVDKAAKEGADIICYAETMSDRGVNITWDNKFEPVDGKFGTMMKQKAKENGVYLFYTFHEIDEDGARHNTAVLIDRQGEVVGIHRKVTITIGEFESGMVPGDDFEVFDTELGKIGMLICWDAYFPENARALALRGAEIILVSTAGNPTHRHIAIAKENGVFVVVACCGGPQDGYEPTKIINPKGEVIAQAGEDGAVAFADVDIYDEEHRNIFWLSVGAAWTEPKDVYFNEFRPDLYEKLLPEEYK